MAAALPAISIGLGAVGTVSQLNAQKRQAKAQQRSIDQQLLIGKDSLRLQKEHFEWTKRASVINYERQKTLVDAQKQAQLLQQKEAEVQQQLAYDQAQQNANLIETQAEVQARQFLTQLEQEATERTRQQRQQAESVEQNLGEAEVQNDRLRSAATAISEGRVPLSKALEAVLQGRQLDEVELLQRMEQEIGDAQRTNELNKRFATESTGIQRGFSSLMAQGVRRDTELQRQSDTLSNTTNRGLIELGTQRARLGAEAERFSTASQANMSQALAQQQYRSQAANLQSQRAQIQKPSLLSYVNVLGQVGNGLLSAGIIRPRVPNANSGIRNPVGGVLTDVTNVTGNIA